MAPLTPRQSAARHRIEQGLRLAAPALDVVLFAGERLSRAVDRGADEPLPAVRYPGIAPPLPRRTGD